MKKIFAWLDHSTAYLVTEDQEKARVISSGHQTRERFDGEGSDTTEWGQHASNNEKRKENKLYHLLLAYYNELTEILEPYDEILLCGPGTAKDELKNLLSENPNFKGKNIPVETTTEKDESQLNTLARAYFART